MRYSLFYLLLFFSVILLLLPHLNHLPFLHSLPCSFFPFSPFLSLSPFPFFPISLLSTLFLFLPFSTLPVVLVFIFPFSTPPFLIILCFFSSYSFFSTSNPYYSIHLLLSAPACSYFLSSSSLSYIFSLLTSFLQIPPHASLPFFISLFFLLDSHTTPFSISISTFFAFSTLFFFSSSFTQSFVSF